MCFGTPKAVGLGAAERAFGLDSQGMEWTGDEVHTPGDKLQNWPEVQVKEALHNYMKAGRTQKI